MSLFDLHCLCLQYNIESILIEIIICNLTKGSKQDYYMTLELC